MTKEELEKRINEIEWDDSEMKTAQNKLPNDVWETVSTFSNTSGGWIVFGVHQHGKNVDFKSDLVCSQNISLLNGRGQHFYQYIPSARNI
jgi:predicted HTH transcriptional regulator